MRQLQVIRPLLLAGVLAAGSLAALPASAQMDIQSREGIALRDQIAELRHQVEILQDRVAGGGGSSLGSASPPPSRPGGGSDLTAQLLVRVDRLEDQVRQLQGRTDELQNQLQQQVSDLGKRIDDLAFQVQNPQAAAEARRAAQAAAAQSGAGPSPGTLGSLPAAGTLPPRAPGAPPVAPRTPELAMQEGTAALARRDYPTAEAAARDVLTGNRTSPRAYDAQFLLAQAQFGQRQYSQAALSYDDTYNRARKGAHAEDSLLGLAYSLTALNDKPSACQALRKLQVEFPTPRADLRPLIVAATRRADCK